MYIIREVVNCRPGKIAPMLDKFKTIGSAMREMGHEPFRLLSDVTGEPFWTLVAELEVEKIDDFFALQGKLMASPALRDAMSGYHELVSSGRREIYKVEG
jgi:hypothetical protein